MDEQKVLKIKIENDKFRSVILKARREILALMDIHVQEHQRDIDRLETVLNSLSFRNQTPPNPENP